MEQVGELLKGIGEHQVHQGQLERVVLVERLVLAEQVDQVQPLVRLELQVKEEIFMLLHLQTHSP